VRSCSPITRTTTCRCSASTYLVYSQPPSISVGRLLHPHRDVVTETHMTWFRCL
jgi:hypothetical protein